MSLFVCDACLVIANTASDDYWAQLAEKAPAFRCSQCRTGKWHGRFPRKIATPEELRRRFSEFIKTAGFEAVMGRKVARP